MTMTTAERFAERMGGDGQRWENDDGASFDAVIWSMQPRMTAVTADVTRYDFPDGSAIVAAGGGWDVGFAAPATCGCWPAATGGMHNLRCNPLERIAQIEYRMDVHGCVSGDICVACARAQVELDALCDYEMIDDDDRAWLDERVSEIREEARDAAR